MDPIRFSPTTRPAAATPTRPQTPAVTAEPTDSVERQKSSGSGLLDKAKLVSLAGSGGIVASGLLYHAGAIGLAAGVGATAGVVGLVAAGLALAHGGKRLFAGPQPAQAQAQSSRRLLNLAAASSAVASAGIIGTNLAGLAGMYGVIGTLSAVTGGAAILAVGLTAVYIGKKLFAGSKPPAAAPPPQVSVAPPATPLAAAPEATLNLTGTGFAAPVVAGRAAQYLEAHPGASAAEVREALTTRS